MAPVDILLQIYPHPHKANQIPTIPLPMYAKFCLTPNPEHMTLHNNDNLLLNGTTTATAMINGGGFADEQQQFFTING